MRELNRTESKTEFQVENSKCKVTAIRDSEGEHYV